MSLKCKLAKTWKIFEIITNINQNKQCIISAISANINF